MNPYCVPASINVTPLTKDVTSYGTQGHVSIPLSDIHPNFVKFLARYNLELLLAELFYNPPRKISRIHVDALGGDYSKINFVYGGEKSLMCWYSANPGIVKDQIDYTMINTRSVDYAPDEVTLLHRQTIHSPSIVQVGIPHNIINAAKPRWCLSLVPIDIDTKKRITFQQTIEIFKDLVPPAGLEPAKF